MDQLKYEPFLNAAEIGVAVKDGVVTLTGIVDTYNKKIGAELATKKIVGVKAIAEEIQVGVSSVFKRTDPEIAEAVVNALKWHTSVPEDRLKVRVENGIVTLEGNVDWNFQREAARDCIVNLSGVKLVNNFIVVNPKVSASDVKQKIKGALERHALIDAEKIQVEILGSKVILRGTVRSIAERDDAERAAWAAPGIAAVENKLTIELGELVY